MSAMRFCDQARDPWNVIAISMAAVLGTALTTGVVVANDAGTRKLSAEEPAASLRPVSRCRLGKEVNMEQTVLIVDDDVNARIIAETLLRTRGLTVRSAADGPEACDIVRRDGAAVVVLPLAFPGVNGFEVIRCLRARFGALTPSMQPCILAVSNGTNAAVERFALRLGADACLPKTMLPRKFVSTVEQLMATAVQRNGETSV